MKAIFTLLTSLSLGVVLAQCPTDLTLTSQSEVNDFGANYPNCTTVWEPLTIAGVGVTSLSPLSNLVAVNANLHIFDTGLNDLSGLNNLSTVMGELKIFNNDYLDNLNGLQGLSYVSGMLHVGRNNTMVSLSGLEQLDSVGGIFRVANNVNLNNISSLSSLQHVGGYINIRSNTNLATISSFDALIAPPTKIRVAYNPNLDKISGFNNVESVNGNLVFINNTDLDTITGFSSLTAVNGRVGIAHNNSLKDVSGLNNLTNINAGLGFSYNYTYQNFDDFSSLQSIGEGLVIANNNVISDIPGLSNLQNIGFGLRVRKNALLADISGFNSLSNADLGWGFSILNNPWLTDITGFNALNTITNLSIKSNPRLENITGFSNLTTVEGNVILTYNDSIQALSGLNNLNSVGSLSVYNCGFTDLIGLGNLANVEGYFSIRYNYNLNSLSALQLLQNIGGVVKIVGNPNLTDCAVFAICDAISGSNWVTISYNSLGCNNKAEVSENCVPIYSSVVGKAFIDFDCDYLYNADDVTLPNIAIRRSDNNNLIGYTNYNGDYLSLLPINDTLNIYSSNLQGFTATPAEYDIITIIAPIQFTERNFAFCPDSTVYDLLAGVSSYNPVRPGFQTYYNVCYSSHSTQLQDATLRFEIVESTASSYADINFAQAGNIINSDTAEWVLTNIAPFQTNCFSVNVQMSTTTPLGTQLTVKATIFPESDFGDDNYADNSGSMTQTVVGSYDPNDKTADPANLNFETLTDTSFIKYLIRFQNTGTYPATFIEVLDTIEADYDLSTFRMLSASHPYSVTFPADRVIKWRFDDINLPDSTSNEPGSHGYIHFSIEPSDTAPLNTMFSNSASIFFDFNTPVITNISEARLYTPPTSQANSINFDENTTYTFSSFDFPFDDNDGDALNKIRITSLPTQGQLNYNGTPISANFDISAINLSLLTYTPNLNEFGDAYASFQFKVFDGLVFSDDTYLLTINVADGVGTSELNRYAFHVNPNPVRDVLLLSGSLPANTNTFRWQLLNAQGQTVASQTVLVTNVSTQTPIEMQYFAAGVYLLQVATDQTTQTIRVVKW